MMLRALLLCLLALAMLPAQAHKPSDSYLTLDADGAEISGRWDIALRDLDFVLQLDGDGDGALTWDEVRSRHGEIARYALARLELAADGKPCTLAAADQQVDHHTDGAYTVLHLRATCPRPGRLEIGYRLFAEVDPQHRGLLQLRHYGHATSAIFGPDNARQSFTLDAPDRTAQLLDYGRMGVWHIWVGFDHILFLLSLLLPAVVAPRGTTSTPPRFSAVCADAVRVVTAFTVAHSVTLALSSLHLVELPTRLVESVIAASVVLAALNNIFPLLGGRRAPVAFAFGLVHGFGFAGVLAGLGLPQHAMVLSLMGFNLGVELGQLAIVAIFLPFAFLMRETRFYSRLAWSGSALVAVLALGWLAERALDVQLFPA